MVIMFERTKVALTRSLIGSFAGLVLVFVLLAQVFSGCGNFDRDNPYDPKFGDYVGDLETALVGTWSLETSSENQVYVFKPDGSVNLFDYSAPDGGVVDRNKGFPDTRMTRFLGTYTWHAGPLMRINFTNSWTNEPGAEDPTLPPAGKVLEVRITRNSLILTDSTGERTYARV